MRESDTLDGPLVVLGEDEEEDVAFLRGVALAEMLGRRAYLRGQ